MQYFEGKFPLFKRGFDFSVFFVDRQQKEERHFGADQFTFNLVTRNRTPLNLLIQKSGFWNNDRF